MGIIIIIIIIIITIIIIIIKVDDGGTYECEIEADGDRPISVTHRLDILIPPKVRTFFTCSYRFRWTKSLKKIFKK